MKIDDSGIVSEYGETPVEGVSKKKPSTGPMTLEQQVVSLQLAKQLKEAGYPQDESLFYWYEQYKDLNTGKGNIYWEANHETSWFPSPGSCVRRTGNKIAAPTVAELGEKMPIYIQTHKTNGEQGKKWYCSHMIRKNFSNEDTEANARAKMWLYLKKENVL